MKMQVIVSKFYPEEFKRKADRDKYSSKGTCEVHLLLDHLEMDVKNITYRVDHEGKVSLKPPFRIHSNKKVGIKPKLVPSVVFKEPWIWDQIEKTIKSELFKEQLLLFRYSPKSTQLDLWEQPLGPSCL